MRAIFATVIVVLSCVCAWAETPTAGTTIDNEAFATYRDASSGIISHLNSNVVSARIEAFEALQLEADHTLLLAPGSSFSTLHVLTNTGTVATSFNVSLMPVGGASVLLQTLVGYWDVNKNGKADPGEPTISSFLEVSLQPGESTNLIVYGVISADAITGSSAQVKLSARSVGQGAQASNLDTLQLQAGVATLQLTKGSDVSSAAPNSDVTFTIAATNNGSATATGTSLTIDGDAQTLVVLRDQIPANTNFSAVTLSGATTDLYHRSGAPAQEYLTAQPVDKSEIDAIAFAFPPLEVSQRINVGFKVTIRQNASGAVTNTAEIYARSGSDDLHVLSNQVNITLPSLAPNIGFYSDSKYAHSTSVSMVGSSVYVQASAAQCNLDPSAAETHTITITSSLTSDRESFTAVETGSNTGMFRINPNVPTRDGSSNAVVIGNGTMEILRSDVLTAVLQGCGSASAQATLLVDPSGVVFDSRTNEPVANAKVSLIDISGQGNGGHPGDAAKVIAADGVTAAPSTVMTASDGRFAFPLIAASTYKLVVDAPVGFTFPSTLPTTQLPIGRNISSRGSYNLDFDIATTTAIQVDIPVDRSTKGTTMLEKTASVSAAEIGDFVDYTITVKNVSSAPVSQVKVNDTLPRGFSYQLGTTRVAGARASDPKGGHGPALQFVLDRLSSNSQTTITYRVHIGQGTKLGKNKNLAVGTDGVSTSNSASAVVDVQGGAFRQEALIVGKVYADCNHNRKQDAGEIGIPGVRVVLEDQTFAVTDGEGKYSIYGITAHTHVVKLDQTSLPAGFEAESLSNRNSGDAETLFADLKSGEMFKADFATGCSQQLSSDVTQRRTLPEYSGNHNDDAVLGMNFNYDTPHRGIAEVKAASASGILGQAPSASNGASTGASPSNPVSAATNNAATSQSREASGTQFATMSPKASSSSPELEVLAKDIDNRVGFINLEDGQTMTSTQTNIRVKGPKDSVFKVFVNHQLISDKRVGKRISNPARGVDAWEFVGIELRAGTNTLRLVQFDQFGNERGATQIHLVAPKQLQKFQIDLPKDAVADGTTPVKVIVRLLDADNVSVMVPTEVSLESSDGEWQVKDVDPKEPGIQAFVEGGRGEFLLKAPSGPVAAKIRISAGRTQADAVLDFVPELRPMIAAGIVDEVINFRSLGSSASASNPGDVFEQALNNLSLSNASGSTQLQSHVGFSLKGTLRKSYLLTLAYDSDKDPNERLFRDIQPDDYYPVYGDSSIRGYDAQSTSRAYLRMDKGKSYLLYGDFSTQDANPARYLSVYTRSATGLRQHYQNSVASITTFASHDSKSQLVEELAANGTSGPYTLQRANGVVNSEVVEILVRDRNQPALVLSVEPQTRFSDYEFDSDTGQVIFKSPVRSLDENLNPLSIRVTYEVSEGGEKFWLSGIDTNFKINNRVQVGGMYVADLNPTDEYRLMGLNSTVKLADRTTLSSEFAETKKDSIGEGTGYRFEIQHEGSGLNLRSYFGRTTPTFNNANALLNSGRGEAGLKINWRLNLSNRLVVDAIRTEGTTSGGTQVGAQVSIEHTLPKNALIEVGLKHVETGSATTSSSTDGAAGSTSTSLRTRLTMTVPSMTKLRVYSEIEQDVESADKRNVSVGGTYQIFERGKFYVRHELISSLGNTYSLNSQQQEAVTVFGIDTNYMKNAHIFSEYRGNDSFSGRDTEAAIGVRNGWTLRPGLRVNTGIESIKVLSGSKASDSLALTASGEYTASPLWKGTGRFEWRNSATSRSYLNTFGASVRMSSTWSFLGRHLLNVSNSTTSAKNDTQQERLQFGFAYRDTATSVFNALAMIELKAMKTESTTAITNRKTTVLSGNFNYQPASPLVFTGRYATRLTVDSSENIASNSADNLLSGRITYDFSRKWDFGFNSMIAFSRGFQSRQFGYGPEIGRMVAKNLWLSAGYNISGFSDTDLSSENETNRGGFVRFRYKFDERLFKKGNR